MTNYKDKIYTDDWKNFKDIDVPEEFNPTTFLLDKHINTQKTAVIIEGTKYTYAEVLGRVCQVANGLSSLGVEPENRVVIFGVDSIEWITAWLGTIRCGGVPAVVSELYKAPNLLYFIKDTQAKVLIIDEAQISKLKEIEVNLPKSLKQVIVIGQNGDNYKLFKDVFNGMPETFEPVIRHKNDICYMFYSGGTTGTAKGIVHLPIDFIRIPERHGAFWEYDSSDVCYATSKKYFTHGLWPGVLIPLYYGATSAMTGLAPTPEKVIEVIERDRPTKLISVPTIIKNILAHVENTGKVPDFSSLKAVYSASEKMPIQLFEKFQEVFGIELMDSIGSAEVTYEWIANRPKEYKRCSLGKPIFGVEVKLVDADGNEITEPNVEGEAWVKSETACFYYMRKLEKTKETFVGPWVRTGDSLYFDEDGFFWFGGRTNDLFKVKGLWVSPIEIEAAVCDNPKVLEAAVISFEDKDGLTKIRAYVVLKQGFTPSEELSNDIKKHVHAKIGGYKVPEEIKYVSSLPRTTLLKIDRKALRELEK